MRQKRIKLIRMFQLIIITSLISLAAIIMLLHISTRSREFDQRAETMRSDYVVRQKALIKREVERVVTIINERRSRSEHDTQSAVKQRVYEATAIAENIYQQNKSTKSDHEIQQLIVDALRAIRFAQGTGYYFITRLDGTEILFADSPELEGSNLLDIQDVTGKYVVKDTIEIATQSGEGFYEYHWTKPAASGKRHKKISYIKRLEPFDWFIGTGLYVEDIEAQIEANLLAIISKIRFGQDGYIFINRLNGDALVTNGELISGVQKLWEVFDKNPAKTKALFDQEYAAALKPAGDYIYYSMSKLTDPEKEFPKASFIHGIPDLQWLVGAGVYLDNIETNIALLQTELEQQQRSEIWRTALATGAIIVFILMLFHFAISRLKKDLASFVNFFALVAHEEKKIDSDQIYFEDLAQIADSANTMLHDKQVALGKVRLSEEKYRHLFDTALVGFFRSRLSDGLYLDVNAKVAEQIGYKIEEIVGKMKTTDLFQDISQRQKLLATLEAEGEVNDFEVDFILPDGREVAYSLSVRAYPGEGYMEGVAVDITQRKRAEASLIESEERFRNLAELLPEPIFETNLEMDLTYANQSAYNLFGYTAEDFAMGLNSLDMVVPEEKQKVLDNGAAQFRGEKKSRTEYRALKKDGSSFPALFHVNPIVKKGQPCGFRGIIIDLTEQKRAEEEILKLRKLESVGVLAGGIAHDFNNLLSGLFGNIELAKRFLSDEDKAYKYLESAGLSMARATGLTQQLLTFSKGGDPIKETLSLESVITETATFSLRGSNVKLQFDNDPDLWLVAADKGQLSQVVSNLVINAKQAMPDGGIVTITAENIETAAGQQVKICVQDQGIGVAPQHLDKIFDPYFSTKQQGSGLGLASCYSIINKHNGAISVASELNKGTTFTIILPAAEKQKATPVVALAEATRDCEVNSARILLLDDEELLLQMSGTMLEEMGHQVDYAMTGEEA
ncbi:MAG: cache domain-containing protein, partial [Desulfuromusa sp.]|nr:cache domain-containing protein [Desulfuromusa sp.]